MTYSVESNIRRDLTKLLKNTERAIKGKPIKSSLTSDTQIEGLSKAVGDISIRLSSEIDQAMDQRTQFGSVLDKDLTLIATQAKKIQNIIGVM